MVFESILYTRLTHWSTTRPTHSFVYVSVMLTLSNIVQRINH